jgi:hypothetical protein
MPVKFWSLFVLCILGSSVNSLKVGGAQLFGSVVVVFVVFVVINGMCEACVEVDLWDEGAGDEMSDRGEECTSVTTAIYASNTQARAKINCAEGSLAPSMRAWEKADERDLGVVQ